MQDRFFSGQFVNHIEGRSLDFDCTATELGLKTNSLPEFYGHWNKSIMYEKQKIKNLPRFSVSIFTLKFNLLCRSFLILEHYWESALHS